MDIVRFECYCPKRDGSWDSRCVSVTFATKTPLVLYFFLNQCVAFRFNGQTYIAREHVPPRPRREIGEGVHCRSIVTLEMKLKEILTRLLEPPDLSVDTPPGIVSEWLRDRGLDYAADAVLEGEKEKA